MCEPVDDGAELDRRPTCVSGLLFGVVAIIGLWLMPVGITVGWALGLGVGFVFGIVATVEMRGKLDVRIISNGK